MASSPHPGNLLRRCADFVRTLRNAGVATDQASTIEFCRALELIDLGNPADFRAVARTTLVHRRDDLPPFEAAFTAYWHGLRPPATHGGADGETETSRTSPRVPAKPADHVPPDGPDDPAALYSTSDDLAVRDLATLNEQQVEQARRIIRQFANALPTVRTRRFRSSRRGRMPDFQRMLRAHARHGLDDVALPYRHRPPRRTRLVLLCDVSGSMRSYSGFLLELIHGLRRELPATEIAVFATRLTVISELLDARDISRALRDVMTRAGDWGGGTDIGGCLQTFNRRYARTLVSGRSVVVLLSDGWDRGDPRVMREEIARLRRHVNRLIWLTPLLRYADYEPLTRGMRAALPHIDLVLPCHSIQALARFTETLRRQWR